MDHCIVYFSTARWLFQEEDLSAILRQSRHNNATTGITGVLLYVRGGIIQVLEGKKEVVEALYQRIKQDQRHINVTQVLNRIITQRLFSDWTMGYETITESQLEEIRLATNVGDDGMLLIEPNDNIILRLIRVFYNSNRHN